MNLVRVCLVHYHEIGLKGHNRSFFEKRLVSNLKALLSDCPIEDIKRISGRLCVFINEDATYEQACDVQDRIAGIPGVARISCGYKCSQDLEIMYEVAIKALQDVSEFETFKVSARRNHTDFATDSMQLNQLVGAALCRAFPEKKVKMKNPDVEVRVEVIQGHTYIYARSLVGVGGLPVGTAGKVMCLISSGIDSPVATWRLARRGAVCVGIHFSGRPETIDTSEYLCDDIAHVLEKTGCFAKLFIVPIGEYQREIASLVPPSLRIIMYRRFMYRIADRVAKIEGAKALVTGESLGQVASQTLENIQVTNEVVSLPVFRPLIGSDKIEIIKDAQKLGTFDVSSQDAPDCCTLFMPRSPETHANLEEVLRIEADLPIEKWTEEVMAHLEVRSYNCPGYKKPKQKCCTN